MACMTQIPLPPCLSCRGTTFTLQEADSAFAQVKTTYLCDSCTRPCYYWHVRDAGSVVVPSPDYMGPGGQIQVANWLRNCLEPAYATRVAEAKLFREQGLPAPAWHQFPCYPPKFPFPADTNVEGGYYDAAPIAGSTNPLWIRIDPYVSNHLQVPTHPDTLATERYFSAVWDWIVQQDNLVYPGAANIEDLMEQIPNRYWGADSHEPWYTFTLRHPVHAGSIKVTCGHRKRVHELVFDFSDPTSTIAIHDLAKADGVTFSATLPLVVVKLGEIADWEQLAPSVQEILEETHPDGTYEETPKVTDGGLATRVLIHANSQDKFLEYMGVVVNTFWQNTDA